MDTQLPIYLDHNATTPMDPRVLEAMLPYFIEKFGNASSRTHSYGWEAEEAVDIAREQVAALIGASSQEIIFTSGATEACNLAIKGAIELNKENGKHIITVSTEHRAVGDTCNFLEKNGMEITRLKVNELGLINIDDLTASIREDTVLIAVMYANNETGVIQPISEIGALARRSGILFFTDATQAVGKIAVDVHASNVDLLAMSAHKLYGPKGVGALFVRKRNPSITLPAQMEGGGHERNMRSGTLNVPGIVGFGKACEICLDEMAAEQQRVANMRDQFENELKKLKGVHSNGDSQNRLPHTTNLSFDDVDGEKLIFQAGNAVAFSRSSACSSATWEPSFVLKAMGLDDQVIHSTFRFSFGRFSTNQEAEKAAAELSTIIKSQRDEGNR